MKSTGVGEDGDKRTALYAAAACIGINCAAVEPGLHVQVVAGRPCSERESRISAIVKYEEDEKITDSV